MEAVPQPGPRPELFAFPFAEAAAASEAMDAAADELRGLLAVHSDAVAVARVNFEGETREHFDRGFAQLMAEVERGLADLRATAGTLADDIDSLGDWTRADQAHTAAATG